MFGDESARSAVGSAVSTRRHSAVFTETELFTAGVSTSHVRVPGGPRGGGDSRGAGGVFG